MTTSSGRRTPQIVQVDDRYYVARVSGPRHANRQAPVVAGWVEVAELQSR